MLLLVTLITGLSAVYISNQLKQEDDVTPDDSSAANPCSISNQACSDSKVCEWPKTAFCTCDSDGEFFSGSKCECVNCYKQRYPSSYNGACKYSTGGRLIDVCDSDPDPSVDDDLDPCPSGWIDCGTSLNRIKTSSKCQRMDTVYVRVEVQSCNNSSYIYKYCEPPGVDPTNTPKPTNTPIPTNTPTDVPTNTPVPTLTDTPRPTRTPNPTWTPTATPTVTPTPTNTPTPSPTPTGTIVPSNTPTITLTPTVTPTNMLACGVCGCTDDSQCNVSGGEICEFSADANCTNTGRCILANNDCKFDPIGSGCECRLPATAIVSDEADRLIIGMLMVFVGWSIYWFSKDNTAKLFFASIKNSDTYRAWYKKTHPNDKEAFFEKLNRKYGDKDGE